MCIRDSPPSLPPSLSLRFLSLPPTIVPLFLFLSLHPFLYPPPALTSSRRPKKEAAYNEQLVISSSANRIRCLLTGWGVSPTFEMQGLPAESGIIDAGDVLVGSDQELPFTLKNNSPFEVSFCVLLRSVGEANSSGVQPFDCIPSEASIPADSEKQLKLLFIPDVESEHFVANFKVIPPLPNCQTFLLLLSLLLPLSNPF
eukprot:736938-Hanusia_phi.AAC.1